MPISKQLATWNKEHPLHYEGLQKQAQQLMTAKKWADAKTVLTELVKIDPRTALPMLATVERSLNEASEERRRDRETGSA